MERKNQSLCTSYSFTFFSFYIKYWTDEKYHHIDIQVYKRHWGKKTKVMKAKMLGESDNFLKTKPVHNGIKACSKKVPKKKKKRKNPK